MLNITSPVPDISKSLLSISISVSSNKVPPNWIVPELFVKPLLAGLFVTKSQTASAVGNWSSSELLSISVTISLTVVPVAKPKVPPTVKSPSNVELPVTEALVAVNPANVVASDTFKVPVIVAFSVTLKSPEVTFKPSATFAPLLIVVTPCIVTTSVPSEPKVVLPFTFKLSVIVKFLFANTSLVKVAFAAVTSCKVELPFTVKLVPKLTSPLAENILSPLFPAIVKLFPGNIVKTVFSVMSPPNFISLVV